MLPIPNYQHGEVHPQVLDSKAGVFRNVKSIELIRAGHARTWQAHSTIQNHNFCCRLAFGS
jgi:hypothetical protein